MAFYYILNKTGTKSLDNVRLIQRWGNRICSSVLNHFISSRLHIQSCFLKQNVDVIVIGKNFKNFQTDLYFRNEFRHVTIRAVVDKGAPVWTHWRWKIVKPQHSYQAFCWYSSSFSTSLFVEVATLLQLHIIYQSLIVSTILHALPACDDCYQLDESLRSYGACTNMVLFTQSLTLNICWLQAIENCSEICKSMNIVLIIYSLHARTMFLHFDFFLTF